MKIFYYTLSLTTLIITIFCIIFPNDMLNSTKSALNLWYSVIVPSLLPFLIISDLLQQTAITKIFSHLLSPIMRKVFKLPGVSSIAVFLGMTGGYPIGAKVTADLRTKNLISYSDAKHLIAFTNNAGPLFLSAAIGIGLYKSPMIGFLLIISHYFSALLVGFLFRFLKKEKGNKSNENLEFKIFKISELGSILSNIIKSSVLIVCTIGGFIILFSLISTILEKLNITTFIANLIMPTLPQELSNGIIAGILEVTTGVNKLAKINIPIFNKLIITSMLIGFGGFSIHMQTLGVISSSDIKFSSYFCGKLFQCLISGLLTFIFIKYTFFGNVLSIATSTINNCISFYGFSKLIFTIVCLLSIIIMFKIVQVLQAGDR